MNAQRGNFANNAVWYTIVFKISALHFFGQKLSDVTTWWKIQSSILITIIVEKSWIL